MAHFKEKARILEVIVNRDPDRGWGVGSGAVKFASLTEAEDLIEKFSGKTTILGVPLSASPPVGERSLGDAHFRTRTWPPGGPSRPGSLHPTPHRRPSLLHYRGSLLCC